MKETEMKFVWSLFFKVMLILVAISSFQLHVAAQNRGEQSETFVAGETAMAWVAYGELIRLRAFNPLRTESGKPNDSISVQLRAFDEHGALLQIGRASCRERVEMSVVLVG